LKKREILLIKILLPVIQAVEVYNNLNNYLVIDLRDSSAFLKGHIEGANNIPNDSLFNYIGTNYTRFSKVCACKRFRTVCGILFPLCCALPVLQTFTI